VPEHGAGYRDTATGPTFNNSSVLFIMIKTARRRRNGRILGTIWLKGTLFWKYGGKIQEDTFIVSHASDVLCVRSVYIRLICLCK